MQSSYVNYSNKCCTIGKTHGCYTLCYGSPIEIIEYRDDDIKFFRLQKE